MTFASCTRATSASDALERSGPVAAAARAAVYASEEEEEGENEGRSVEEEEQQAEDEDKYLPPGAYLHEADEIIEPPSHCGHPHGVLELAQPGYLVRSSTRLVTRDS
jgi:hypothetical protein